MLNTRLCMGWTCRFETLKSTCLVMLTCLWLNTLLLPSPSSMLKIWSLNATMLLFRRGGGLCRYDRICKVEPFQRALRELECDMMVNGRRRDHGVDRASLQLFSLAGNGLANCQPLAYWSFEDCFTFASQEGFSLHPLHEQGYPSVGDVHSTVPVDRSKWCALVQCTLQQATLCE